MLAFEQVVDRLRDHRLAIPWRSVDEHGVSAIDRRAQLVDHAVADDEM